MIKRSEDLSQQEIDILDNLSWMFKEGLIDANANIISGKEEEFGFASVKESVEKVFQLDSDASENIVSKFKEMSEDDIVDKENQDRKRSIQEAQFYLHKTDWYAFRKADSGKEIPEEIKTKREEARQTISELEE